eukprot:IDg14139t1
MQKFKVIWNSVIYGTTGKDTRKGFISLPEGGDFLGYAKGLKFTHKATSANSQCKTTTQVRFILLKSSVGVAKEKSHPAQMCVCSQECNGNKRKPMHKVKCSKTGEGVQRWSERSKPAEGTAKNENGWRQGTDRNPISEQMVGGHRTALERNAAEELSERRSYGLGAALAESGDDVVKFKGI